MEKQGSLYLTGDVHGKPMKRFSFRNNKWLKKLKKEDIMVVLGDFGVPFGVNHPMYENHYKDADDYALKWMNDRPWGYTIVLLGNHDDRGAIAQMETTVFQGHIFPHIGNIIYVNQSCVLELAGFHCLLIPGAESHDRFYRTKDIDWWDDEAIDIEAAKRTLLTDDGPFDIIMTHDIPAGNLVHYRPTDGERFLETVAQTVDYGKWYHGHMHMEHCRNDYRNIQCLYEHIKKIEKGQ